jgi:hypothetical protein
MSYALVSRATSVRPVAKGYQAVRAWRFALANPHGVCAPSVPTYTAYNDWLAAINN